MIEPIRDTETGKTKRINSKRKIHELMTGFMVILIIVHTVGVVVSRRVHGENYILAMLTGNKKIP